MAGFDNPHVSYDVYVPVADVHRRLAGETWTHGMRLCAPYNAFLPEEFDSLPSCSAERSEVFKKAEQESIRLALMALRRAFPEFGVREKIPMLWERAESDLHSAIVQVEVMIPQE
jgi:hypothetical protein